MSETLEFAQFYRMHYGGRQVNTGDVEGARWKLRDIMQGLTRAFQHHATLPAQHPFSDLALGCAIPDNGKQKEGRDELAHLAIFYWIRGGDAPVHRI